MNNSSTTADLCSSLRVDSTYLALTLVGYAILILSASGNAFSYFLLSKTRSLPTNVTYLLRNSSFSIALLAATASVLRGAFGVYICVNGFVPMTRLQCNLIELPTSVLGFAFMLSITIIGIDRLANTIPRKHRHLIDSDKPSTLAYTMKGVVWLVSIVLPLLSVMMSYLDPASASTICYCNGALTAPPMYSVISTVFFIVVEVLTIVCYCAVYCRSRSSYLSFSINTTQHSLAHRYQMLSNIRTTILLTPSIVIHALAYVIMFGAGILVPPYISDAREPMVLVNFLQAIFVFGCIEGALHPFWLLRHEHYLRTASKYLPFLKRFLNENAAKPKSIAMMVKDGGVGHGRSREIVRAVGGPKPAQRFRGIFPRSNQITAGVVDFRMRPDQNNDLLMNMWTSRPIVER